jgi:hypothetical protein
MAWKQGKARRKKVFMLQEPADWPLDQYRIAQMADAITGHFCYTGQCTPSSRLQASGREGRVAEKCGLRR